MAKLNEDLAKAIQSSLSASVDGEVANVASEGDVFDKHLPEGLTPEVVSKVDNYVTDFAAAAASAAGAFGNELMVKEAGVQTIRTSIPMGSFGGSANFSQKREVERSVPGSDKKVTVYGGMSADIEFTAGQNSGALGKALRATKAAAAELYGKKA